jgi:hypothetical protein
MDLYFKRHDGQAVTCDDFAAAMADANDVDLSSLAQWCVLQRCSGAVPLCLFIAALLRRSAAVPVYCSNCARMW